MKIGEELKYLEDTLRKAGIGTSRLDALVLLEDATGKDRTYLLAHPNEPLQQHLQGASLKVLSRNVDRRVKHEPLAYIREKCEFYGREFFIDRRVLVPRPESETMIEQLKLLVNSQQSSVVRKKSTEDKKLETRDNNLKIIDVGTGSGALAVIAKLEFPSANVIAIDIDPKCLEVAKKNAKKHKIDVEFLKSDLLQSLNILAPTSYLLLCNLPYVPDSYTVNEAAKSEPKIAIYGGADGLDLYRKLFRQIAAKLQKPGWILAESLPFQHKELEKTALIFGYKLTKTDDFIQLFQKD